jgi:hypothetical protein
MTEVSFLDWLLRAEAGVRTHDQLGEKRFRFWLASQKSTEDGA